MAGAPFIMNLMLNYEKRFKFKHDIKMWVAGAAPPPSVMLRFKEELGVQAQAVSSYYHPCLYPWANSLSVPLSYDVSNICIVR